MATVIDLTGNTVKADGFEGPVTNDAVQALVADAEESHDVNAVFSDVEVEAALDALGAKLNELIAAVKGS